MNNSQEGRTIHSHISFRAQRVQNVAGEGSVDGKSHLSNDLFQTSHFRTQILNLMIFISLVDKSQMRLYLLRLFFLNFFNTLLKIYKN